ncbi:MAG: AAA family ATPase [Lachnospiraceae bacterium]|nr:AAA family ATPase [Lachnospiraceae bacterium]
MILKSVECEQFAGLTDKEYKFSDGLNIVLGDNESGKSSMMDLIYNMFFKNIKLDSRSDGSFISNYFPNKVSGIQGDAIDGEISFETSEGVYKLKKEWEKNGGVCSLRTPDGTKLKDSEKINDILKDILGYGAGVYSEIVFPSQKRNSLAVESIMREVTKKKTADPLDDVKSELSATLNKAALETGGVSIDKMEAELKNILHMYSARWDFDNDMPEGGVKRGIENKWSDAKTGAAEDGKQAIILKSYYDMKEIEQEQKRIVEAEKNVEYYNERLKKVTGELNAAEEKREQFNSIMAVLGQVSTLNDRVKDIETSIKEQKDAIATWPICIDGLNVLEELKRKLEVTRLKELYNKVNAVKEQLDIKNKELQSVSQVNPEDIRTVKTLQNTVNKLEGQLSGMNLVAKIKKLSDVAVDVKTASNGKSLSGNGDEYHITEAVDISIPGIIDMSIMPMGVDVEQVKCELDTAKAGVAAVFMRYGVEDIDSLETMSAKYQQIKQEIDRLQEKIHITLNGSNWEEISNQASKLGDDVPTESQLLSDIATECKGGDLLETMASYRNKIAYYQDKYETMDKLQEVHKNTLSELDKVKEKLASAGELPEEYKCIEDPDAYGLMLKNNVTRLSEDREQMNNYLNNAIRDLGDNSSESLEELREQAEAKFKSGKKTYEHWLNIYRKFFEVKENNKANPVEDIVDNFKRYLSIITNNKVSVREMKDDLGVRLSSDSHALTYDILSDGTKETIALAFRLAMHKHLFPKGNGIIILDDPCTDMDPTRTKKSCELIQEFAKDNQVIFVTCDDKYNGLMYGNVVNA